MEPDDDTVRRRRRPAVSCSNCRRRKIRCNRQAPCNNCTRSRNHAPCVYDHHPPLSVGHTSALPDATAATEGPQSSVPGGSSTAAASPAASQPSTTLVATSTSAPEQEYVVRESAPDFSQDVIMAGGRPIWKPRIRPFINRVAGSNRPLIRETATSIGGSFFFDDEVGGPGRKRGIVRSVGHKRRLFLQGHWMNLVPWVNDMLHYFEVHVKGGAPEAPEKAAASVDLNRCKTLARYIKACRIPAWPSPPTRDLPPREVADKLVESYLRSIETVYRILHVPTFRKDYEAIWLSGAEPDMGFLVLVKLVMAVGAATCDNTFSCRDMAVRWIYEASTWHSNPVFKMRVRPDLVGIQSHILLLIARELAGIDDDGVWIAAGTLIREGMFAVLNRDPSRLPWNTKLAAEMRRRLWATILEVSLQTSMSSGSQPHLSLDEFDAEPPGNYDDEDLLDEDSAPKPDDTFTQTSVARALRKTFPQRLAVVKHLNDLGPHGSYEETLRLDTEVRKAWKAMSRTLQACGPTDVPAPGHFARRTADYIMSHYLSVLHIPYFGVGLHEAKFAYSRKVVVETALKAWSIAHASISNPDVSKDANGSPVGDDLSRLCEGGCSGYFRTVSFQSAVVVAMELVAQVQEGTSLGPVNVRADLLFVVESTRDITLRALGAGRTNMKGHLLMSLFLAHLDGLRRGLDYREMVDVIGRAAGEAEGRALPALERVAARYHGGAAGAPEPEQQQQQQVPLGDSLDLMGAWDFLMSDPLFTPADGEPADCWDDL